MKYFKKAIKWYCDQAMESQAWTPSCMVPYK